MAAVVCVDKGCQERTGWLCADMRLIGQVFRHRLVELHDDKLFNAYIEKNQKKPWVLSGIVAAHSNGKLHELWNKQVRGESVTLLPFACAMLAVMQAWKIWVDFDWDMTMAATMGNTSIVQVLLDMDVPREKLCLEPEKPLLVFRHSLAALHLDAKSLARHIEPQHHKTEQSLLDLLLQRQHLATLHLNRPHRQFKTPRTKLPTPLETVDKTFRQAFKESFPWRVVDGVFIQEDPKQLAIVQLILRSPKYGHRVSCDLWDCTKLIDHGKTELARWMLTLPQLATTVFVKKRKTARLCIAIIEGNVEGVERILIRQRFAIAAWDGLAWLSVVTAFHIAVERGHRGVYALGRAQLFSQHPVPHKILKYAITSNKPDIIANLLQFEEGHPFPELEEALQKAFSWKKHEIIKLILSYPKLLRRGGVLDRVIDLCLLGLDTPLPDSVSERRAALSDWGVWDTCQGLYFTLIKRVLKSKWRKEVTLDCLKRVEDCLVKAIEGAKKYDSLSAVILKLHLRRVIEAQAMHLISTPNIPPLPQTSHPLSQPSELIDEKETHLVEPQRWYTRLLSAGIGLAQFIISLFAQTVQKIASLWRQNQLQK